MRRERIVNSQVVTGKLAGTQVQRRGVENDRIGHNLAETLVAQEDPVLILLNGSAERASELVGTVVPFDGADAVILGGVGVENGVVEVLEHLAVPLVGAGFQGGNHRATAGPPKLRVVGVDHHLEFLNGIDARREEPTSGNAHRRAIHEELVRTLASTIDDELAIRVPTAQAGKTVRTELFLRENDAGSQADQ